MTVWRLVTHHSDSATALRAIREEEEIALGWNLVGDAGEYGSAKEISEAAKAAYPELPTAPFSGTQLWNFSRVMEPGDLVIVGVGERRLFVVEVAGDYYYEEGDPSESRYLHRRPAVATDLDAEAVWRDSGGVAEGEGIRWALVKCRRGLNAEEIAKNTRAAPARFTTTRGTTTRTSVARSSTRTAAISTRITREPKAVMPGPDQLLVVLNLAENLFEFSTHSIYTCPSDAHDFRTGYKHYPAKFGAIYYSRAVPAVAEIDAVVRLTSDSAGVVLWKFVPTSDEDLVADALSRWKAEEKAVNKPPCLVFLFRNKRRTEFEYDTRGGFMASRQYFDLTGLTYHDAESLASSLRRFSWTSLPRLKI